MYEDFKDEFSYFLGFFWGDGSIKGGSTALKIVSKDGRVLKKLFGQFLEFSYKEKMPSQKGVVKRQRISIFNKFPKDLFLFLKDYGYDNKSKIAPTDILKMVNPRYFWQGLIDADGCFYESKSYNGGTFSLSSSVDQDWSEVENWLKSIGVESYSIFKKANKKGKSSSLEVRYGEDIRKIGKYLYGEKILGLKRKFLKYESINKNLKKLSSSTKGISFCKIQKRWRAYHKRVHLGWFKTEEEAISKLESYLNVVNI